MKTKENKTICTSFYYQPTAMAFKIYNELGYKTMPPYRKK